MNGIETNIFCTPGERIIRIGGSQLCRHSDIPAGERLHLCLVFPAHHINVSELLLRPVGCVTQCGIAGDLALHDTEECHLSDKRICHRLKDKQGWRRIVFDNRKMSDRAVSVQNPFSAARGRTRERVGDCVKERLDAPQFRRSTTEYRHNLTVNNAHVNGFHRLFTGNFFPFKVLIHELFARLCDGLKQHVAEFFDIIMEFFRDLTCLILPGLAVKHVHFLLNQVSKSDHLSFVDNRDLQRTDFHTERIAQCIVNAAESRLIVIKAVDKERGRQVCFFCLSPSQLSPDLYSAFSVDKNNGSVGNTDTLPDFPLKIKIAGCIQYVDLYIIPHDGSDGSLQRKAAASLLGIIVGYRIACGNRPEPIRRVCDIQHCLGERGLPAPAMPQQDDIPNLFGLNRSHVCLLCDLNIRGLPLGPS